MQEMMTRPKLLIIDDDASLRTQMKWAFMKDYEVLEASERQSALTIFNQEQPHLVTLDLGLPPDPAGVSEGFLTLEEIHGAGPLAKVVIITGREEKEHALKGIEQGAYDFFCKPIELDDLRVVLRRALHVAQLEQENRVLQQRLHADAFEEILGASSQMEEVFSKIRKVASSDVPVVILGESGTGKELVAKAIHRLSPRTSGKFLAINCGAIPENLLESELFGHEKGAFTGAHALKKGRFEEAEGGTLFLDEIGDLPLGLQVKLLRFLQEQRFVRVGGRQEISVSVRVLAATNTDLQKAMREGRFREDLYFRLSVVTIQLPPLRERQGDVELLARFFLKRFAGETGKNVTGFTSGSVRAMESHSWPGNVRELENRIKRGVIMAEGQKLTPGDLELDSPYRRFEGQALKEAREALERELVQKALAKHKGRVAGAAAELGVSRPTLYELMEKLGLGKK